MERIVLPKSDHLFGDKPDWYRGHRTRNFGEYFGSLSSLEKNETYLTLDRKYIIHRDFEGKVSVRLNRCLHQGAHILEHPGVQNIPDELLRCPIHKWAYQRTGELVRTPHFKKCDGRSLQGITSGIWNGYVLGFPQDELDASLANFGSEINLPQKCIDPQEFVFMGEEEYPLPYPRELMMINYFDGLHVPLYHQKTFDAVTDCGSYVWEVSPDDNNRRCQYSIQLVSARKDVEKHMESIIRMHDWKPEELGWAGFHLWLHEKMPEIETPIDKNLFAVWVSVYGKGFLMPELYEGGRFLAVSDLINIDPDNLETGNINVVEYYVHKSVPEGLRQSAYRKFKYAYEQSAREDDKICETLWQSHRLGGFEFNRVYHETLEKGDAHWRNWFKRHFAPEE